MWISMDALSNNSPPVFEFFDDQDKVVDADQVLKEKSRSNGKLDLKIKNIHRPTGQNLQFTRNQLWKKSRHFSRTWRLANSRAHKTFFFNLLGFRMTKTKAAFTTSTIFRGGKRILYEYISGDLSRFPHSPIPFPIEQIIGFDSYWKENHCRSSSGCER